MVNDIAVQEFVNAIKEEPTDTNTTYSATVSRIDKEGIVWVNIHGSEKETPTASTSTEVKRGDAVTVNWRNNRLYIGGNYSNPSAGIARVEKNEMATEFAIASAQTAQQAADVAVGEAERARIAADEAEQHASEAETQAGIATGYANDALTQLSVVEEVVDTLNWISEHGTYKKTTDTTVAENKMYFTLTGTAVSPTTLGDGTKLSNLESYYEKVNNVYVKTTDTTYNSSKTYYTVTAELVTSPTGNPSTSGYYEIDSIDTAVQNYISSHLALTDSGLYVVKDNSGYKVLLANDGLKVYDNQGHLVSAFGESIVFDSSRPQTIGNQSTYIKWYDSNNDHVADSIEIAGANVNIASSVTIGGMPTKVSDLTNDSGYQTTADVNTAISNIEIGGRNLHKDSANLGSSWAKDGGSTVADGIATIPLSGSGEHRIYQMPASGYWGIWKANTTYTISLDARADTAGLRLAISPYATSVSIKKYDLTTEWQRYSYTFTSGSSTSTASCSYYAENGSSGNVYIKNPKLEYGNKATDWTPAPEDVDAGIANAAQTATSYLTVINGTTGISVHNATDENNFVNVNSSGMKVYKGGHTDSNVVASFGDTVRLGNKSATHAEISSQSLDLMVNDAVGIRIITDNSNNEIIEGTGTGDGTTQVFYFNSDHTPYVSPTLYSEISAYSATINGELATAYNPSVNWHRASDQLKITSMYFGIAPPTNSIVKFSVCINGKNHIDVGTDNIFDSSTYGVNSVAIGKSAKSSGNNSLAAGSNCTASGPGSVAFNSAAALAQDSFAANMGVASESYSAAFGDSNAYGMYSFSTGKGTIARTYSQAVVGKYNKDDTNGDYAFIIGNGEYSTANQRSNALTVDWNGNVDIAGEYSINGTAIADHIVAQGTNGIWTYRKWNSGIAECWGETSVNTVINTAWGSLYRSTSAISANYPAGLFISRPTLTAEASSDSGYAVWMYCQSRGDNTQTDTYYFIRAGVDNTNTKRYANFHAIGKWK